MLLLTFSRFQLVKKKGTWMLWYIKILSLSQTHTPTHTHTLSLMCARAHTHTHTHTHAHTHTSRQGEWALFSLILPALSFVFKFLSLSHTHTIIRLLTPGYPDPSHSLAHFLKLLIFLNSFPPLIVINQGYGFIKCEGSRKK